MPIAGLAFDPSKEVSGRDTFLEREFPMSAKDYRTISALAYEHSGIVLADSKQEMVYSRLSRRLRDRGVPTFSEYLKILQSNWEAEQTMFLNAITTNLTSFFRENHHFEYLAETVVPKLKQQHAKDRKIRVWSTAASTGEEPYSIAMVFREAFQVSQWDIKILATDIDSDVLSTARQGVYKFDRIEGIGDRRQKKWFQQVGKEDYQVDDSLKELLSFKKLNLLNNWPMKGPFDVVFCRNVIIYFDKETQRVLFEKMSKLMPKDSHLFIGHSESLLKVADKYESKGRTIYKRL